MAESALTPTETWTDDLSKRFAQVGYDPSVLRRFWLDPVVSAGDDSADFRIRLVKDLETAERMQGPPTVDEVNRRLQSEAEADPGMPPWIKRPWYVPREHMLAAEAILVERLGFGYSASGSGFGGRDHLRGREYAPGLQMTLLPVPGVVPKEREGRDALQAELNRLMVEAGLLSPRMVLLWDAEPAKAFQGMLCGTIIRLGHVAVGVPREYVHCYGDP